MAKKPRETKIGIKIISEPSINNSFIIFMNKSTTLQAPAFGLNP
jgi:hypothetical protein